MRTALGQDFLLALHLHKAQAHGLPAFRLRLLKPASAPPQDAGAAAAPAPAASAAPAAHPPRPPAQPPHQTQSQDQTAPAPHALSSGWEPVGLLDQAACRNASALHDALHAFHDANGRLAAALRATGVATPGAVRLDSARTVSLADKGAAADPASAAADPAAAAVRSLPAAALGLVSRAVDGLNAAVHSLGLAAAAAPGPASFAALLTHVLGELRELVAGAGGEAALEQYHPAVYFSRGPDLSLSFSLDAHLELLAPLHAGGGGGSGGRGAGDGGGGGGASTGGGGQRLPTFPDCLSPPVRRGWLLLQSLLSQHNAAVRQLGRLGRATAAFEEAVSSRVARVAEDAAAARLPLRAAAAAARALARNQAELKACCQGALTALAATARLVADEMEEAAQLALVQCGFMSPMSWSVSVASSLSAVTAIAPSGSGGGSGVQDCCSAASAASRAAAGGSSLGGGDSHNRRPIGAGGAAAAAAALVPAASPWRAANERASAGGGAAAAPDSLPDVARRPDQPQRQQHAQPQAPRPGGPHSRVSFKAPSPSQSLARSGPAKPAERTASASSSCSDGGAAAGGGSGSQSARCRELMGRGSPPREADSFGGWLPVGGGGGGGAEGAADTADGGDGGDGGGGGGIGGGLTPQRSLQPAEAGLRPWGSLERRGPEEPAPSLTPRSSKSPRERRGRAGEMQPRGSLEARGSKEARGTKEARGAQDRSSGGGSASAGLSSALPRPSRGAVEPDAAAAAAPTTAAAAATGAPGGGRAYSRESLAEEYARAALAHLQLQQGG